MDHSLFRAHLTIYSPAIFCSLAPRLDQTALSVYVRIFCIQLYEWPMWQRRRAAYRGGDGCIENQEFMVRAILD